MSRTAISISPTDSLDSFGLFPFAYHTFCSKPDSLICNKRAAKPRAHSPRTLEAWRRRPVGPQLVRISGICIAPVVPRVNVWLARSVAGREGSH